MKIRQLLASTDLEAFRAIIIFGTEPNAAFVDGKGFDEHHMQCVL